MEYDFDELWAGWRPAMLEEGWALDVSWVELAVIIRHSQAGALAQVAAFAIGAYLKEGGLLTGVPTMFYYEWPFVLVTDSAGGCRCHLRLLVTVSLSQVFDFFSGHESSLIAGS